MTDPIQELIFAAVEANGCEVVRFLRGPKRGLEIMVDRDPSGVTVRDLTTVTRAIHASMEEEGIDPGEFTIEVVSPGVDRPLVREKDFVRFAGSNVHIKLREKRGEDGRKNYKGALVGFEDGSVLVKGPDEEEPWRFRPDEIASARIVPKLPKLKDTQSPASSSSGRTRKPRKARRKRPKEH